MKWTIWLFEQFGLAYDLKRVPDEEIEKGNTYQFFGDVYIK
jgi:fatty-acid desaturase